MPMARGPAYLAPLSPDTLTAQANLATSYWQARRTDEAIRMQRGLVVATRRRLGDDHLETQVAAEVVQEWESATIPTPPPATHTANRRSTRP